MKQQNIFAFFWGLALLLVTAAAWATAEPKQQVQEMVDGVLVVLRDEAKTVDAKKAEIREIIGQRFDFRAMSQRTLAQNWKKASDEEKDRFVALYTRLLEDTYLVAVEEYTSESVEFREVKIKKEKYAQINTAIIASDKEIPVIYKARLKDGNWFVYDVVIEGVSLISNYRNSYQQIAKKEGISGLIARLEEKVACTEC